VIVSPAITEKTTMASERNQVIFNVNRKGKMKRFRGFLGRQSDIKRAIVTLAAGQSIDVTTGL
jgi:large subunit ribosomal protein L23